MSTSLAIAGTCADSRQCMSSISRCYFIQLGESFLGYCNHAMATLADHGKAWWDPRLWAGEVARVVEQFDYPQYIRARPPFTHFSHAVTVGDSTCMTYAAPKSQAAGKVRIHVDLRYLYHDVVPKAFPDQAWGTPAARLYLCTGEDGCASLPHPSHRG